MRSKTKTVLKVARRVKLYHGDCLDVLPDRRAATAHCPLTTSLLPSAPR